MTPPIVVNQNKSKHTLYIGRGSKWGNPFTHLPIERTQASVQVASVEEALQRYEQHAREQLWDSLHELEGQVLGCFCKPKPCHGDVLRKLFCEKFGGTVEPVQLQRSLF